MLIARTVGHLFRQMRSQGRPTSDLELVRRAYDFGTALHSGRFEIDGTPFHVHGLGVASVVSQVGAPAAVIAAGTLHNIYTTGDWGDGRDAGSFPSRRKRVREAVGEDVEVILTGLKRARERGHLDAVVASHAVIDVDDGTRWQLMLDLADLLDKWDDGRIGYSAGGREDRSLVEGSEHEIARLATRLGQPELGVALESAFERVSAEQIPDSLRLGRRYSVVVPPPSWRPRRSVTVRRQARRFLGPVRGKLRRRPT